MMITRDWVNDLIKVGEALNSEAMRHNVDNLRIKVMPELEYVYIRAYRDEKLVMSAQHFGLLDKDDIRMATRRAATPTGDET
ncbi:MAG: hypothetical protein J6S50_00490 [Oscillospiraceae bacterium]|nr:hypothetical protein [Oscillospiraceae bacterium]MBO7726979.1 hypothetical protein [Oscillospiraceae bacterium]